MMTWRRSLAHESEAYKACIFISEMIWDLNVHLLIRGAFARTNSSRIQTLRLSDILCGVLTDRKTLMKVLIVLLVFDSVEIPMG